MEECGRSASLVTTQLRENLMCGVVIHVESHRCTLPVNSIEEFEHTRNFIEDLAEGFFEIEVSNSRCLSKDSLCAWFNLSMPLGPLTA
jgi:hypothetical protein